MTTNTLKIWDNNIPLQFTADGDKFRLQAGTETTRLILEEFDHKELRGRIEPWLTSLFQSEHLSLLAGSSCSTLTANTPTGADCDGQKVERNVNWKAIADD